MPRLGVNGEKCPGYARYDQTASPAFSYLTDASYEAMDFVRQLREQGEACYFTMDAGPNVKVLCQEKDLEHLSEIFGQRYRLIVKNKGFEPR